MVVADIEGVVKEVPEPSEAPPVKAVYQLIVPAEDAATKSAVPAAHIVAPVEDVIVGTAVTVPVADTAAEAEVDELSRLCTDAQVMSPLGEPLDVVVGICTYTVADTDPSVGVSVILEAYPLPDEAETSNPVGAVTVRSFVKY
jgi:hypothetical protein